VSWNLNTTDNGEFLCVARYAASGAQGKAPEAAALGKSHPTQPLFSSGSARLQRAEPDEKRGDHFAPVRLAAPNSPST